MTTITPTLDHLSDPAPPPGPADWNDEGVLVLPGLIPDDLIAAYEDEWKAANGWRGLSLPGDPFGHVREQPTGAAPGIWQLHADNPGGWDDCTPYMRYPALRELVCYDGIQAALDDLLGEPAGVHLNLTGWVSTERNWHQDGYLNPEHVGDAYAAVWIALGDVHARSGPFQYIPGSHRWHRLTREKIGRYVDLSDPAWPKHSEDVLTPLVDAVVANKGPFVGGPGVPLPLFPEVVTYLPRKGDVLIWHPRLYHRGAKAQLPGAYRPAVIAHYSGVYHRQDMPEPVLHTDRYGEPAGWLFPIESSGPVR